MKTKKIIQTVFVTMFVTMSAGLTSAQLKDEKAAKVLNDYVEAIGGKVALNTISNLVSHSSLEFVGSDFTLVRKIVETNSNQYYIQVNSARTGEITRTIQQNNCREQSRNGVRDLEGEEKQSFLNASAFLRFANWEKTLSEYKYEGLENVEGQNMHKLSVVTIYGIRENWFFSEDTKLLCYIEEELELFGEKAVTTTVFLDYRNVKNLKLSFQQTVKMPGQTRKIIFDEIFTNQEFDPAIFNL